MCINFLKNIVHDSLGSDEKIIDMYKLSGGLCTKIYFCQTNKEKYIIRVYKDKNIQDFDHELHFYINTSSPLIPYLYFYANKILALQYVEGIHIDKNYIKKHIMLNKISDLIYTLHNSGKCNGVEENIIIKKLYAYIDKIDKNRNNEYYEYLINESKHIIFDLQKNKGQCSPTCHNDLHIGNIIYDDKKDKINLIDFGFAGYNFIEYDIANLFNEIYGDELETKIGHYEHMEEILKSFIQIFSENYKNLRADNIVFFIKISHFFWACWGFYMSSLGFKINDNDYYHNYAINRLCLYKKIKQYV